MTDLLIGVEESQGFQKGTVMIKDENLAGKNIGTIQSYRNGEVIFEGNSNSKEIYIIESGQVEISQFIGDQKTSIAMLSEGELFGEMAAITDSLRYATAAAIGKVTLLSMSMEDIFQRMADDRLFMIAMVQRLIGRLRYTAAELKTVTAEFHSHRMQKYHSDQEGTRKEDYSELRNLISDLREKTEQKDRQIANFKDRITRSERTIESQQLELFKHRRAWYKKLFRRSNRPVEGAI